MVRNLTELCKVAIPEGRSGKWRVEQFEVKEDIEHAIWRLHCGGRDVPNGNYTRLIQDGASLPMMSDTPSEIYDHAEAIWKIEELGGRVLINGLGLGCILKAALSFPNVTRVDVVEISPDVIHLVAPSYNDPRVHIFQADAYSIEWLKSDTWTVAWHDIWPSICSDNLPEMGRLHRKYGRKVQWQGSWLKGECKRMRGCNG